MRKNLESSFTYSATDEGMSLFLAKISTTELHIILKQAESCGMTLRQYVAAEAIRLDRWHLPVELVRVAITFPAAAETSFRTEEAIIEEALTEVTLTEEALTEEETATTTVSAIKDTWIGLPALDPVTHRALGSL